MKRTIATLSLGVLLWAGTCATAALPAEPSKQTVKDVFDGFKESDGASTRWVAGALMVAAAGGVGLAGGARLRRWWQVRRLSPAAVGREVFDAAGLSRRHRKHLNRLALHLGTQTPAALVLCPSLIRRAVGGSCGRADQRVLRDVLARLGQ